MLDWNYWRKKFYGTDSCFSLEIFKSPIFSKGPGDYRINIFTPVIRGLRLVIRLELELQGSFMGDNQILKFSGL
jgi:hypothetical protein